MVEVEAPQVQGVGGQVQIIFETMTTMTITIMTKTLIFVERCGWLVELAASHRPGLIGSGEYFEANICSGSVEEEQNIFHVLCHHFRGGEVLSPKEAPTNAEWSRGSRLHSVTVQRYFLDLFYCWFEEQCMAFLCYTCCKVSHKEMTWKTPDNNFEQNVKRKEASSYFTDFPIQTKSFLGELFICSTAGLQDKPPSNNLQSASFKSFSQSFCIAQSKREADPFLLCKKIRKTISKRWLVELIWCLGTLGGSLETTPALPPTWWAPRGHYPLITFCLAMLGTLLCLWMNFSEANVKVIWMPTESHCMTDPSWLF